MGGLMILIAMVVSTVLWADLANGFVWVALGITVSYGFIGFLDDYLKVSRRNHKGLPGKMKLALQVAFALAAAFWIMRLMPGELETTLAVPFFQIRPCATGVVLPGVRRFRDGRIVQCG